MPTKYRSKILQGISNLPPITLGLIGINVVAMFLTYPNFKESVSVYGLIPSQLRLGSLLTANFLHDGYFHLTLNMFLLYIFGSRIERAMGKIEFILFYLGACFASSLMHIIMILASLPPYYATRAVVGASGAISGLIGIYAVRFHKKIFHYFGIRFPILILIMAVMLLQLLFAILGLYMNSAFGINFRYVAYWSHLGGFIFGLSVALLANMALQGEREHLMQSAIHNDSEGNFLEAARDLESLIAYDPDNTKARAFLGRLWAIMNEEDQSVPNYLTSIELDINQGNEEAAILTANEMLGFWPKVVLVPHIQYRFASYLKETGDTDKALALFNELVANYPDTVEAQMSMLKIGQIQFTLLNQPQEAAATLLNYIDRYPASEWRKFAEDRLAHINRQIDNCSYAEYNSGSDS